MIHPEAERNRSGADSAASGALHGAPEAPRPLRPHSFEVAGKKHVFDPSSGRLFRADVVASEVVALIGERDDGETAAELSRHHERRLVDESMCEVRRYVSEGKLAGPLFERPHPELQPVTPRIVSVTLNAASVCNLDCIYCWNRGGAYGRMEQKRLMDRETAIRAIDLANASGFEKGDILVDIYGGEPLLNFDVVRAAMEHCKEIEKESGGKRTFSFKVTTNGTLLTQEMVDFLSAMGTSLGISIDGTKKVHNRNRPFPGGGSTWDLIRRNVAAAVEARNIHVSARATLVPPHIDMVKATKALFREGFYDTSVEYASEACQAFKPGGFPAYSETEIEAMKREYLKFAKLYLSYSLYKDEAIDIGLSNNITRVLYETHRFSPCGAGSNFITVSEDGTVYPCIGFIGMPEYRLGSVSEGIDLDRLAKFRHRMRSVVHEAENCADCWARHICQGNCPANNEQHNRDLFKAYRRGCEWLRYKLEVAMWVASELALRKPSRLKGYRPV